MTLPPCTCPPMHDCARHGVKVQENRKARQRPWASSMPYSTEGWTHEQIYRAGIKDDRIYMMNRYDPDGAHCEECGVKVTKDTCDLAHWERRGKSGDNRPDNQGLLCNDRHPAGHDCHSKYDNNDLRFTRAGA